MRGDQSGGLVIPPELGGHGRFDRISVNLDPFPTGDLEGGGGQAFAVYTHPTVLDHTFHFPARGDPGAGKVFGDAFGRVGGVGQA